jgi:hypothetical protein
MPIEYRIHHPRRLVVARGVGVFSDTDAFGYQQEVWSRKDVNGYDELMDMTAVTEILVPSPDRVRQLAVLASNMDSSKSAGRFAVIAPQDVAYGLGRMYQAHRNLSDGGARAVAIFRTEDEARVFLGIETAFDLWVDSRSA